VKVLDGTEINKALLASIIISTYNRCAALCETLEALSNQTVSIDQYEVIVVDNGSKDDTYEQAKKFYSALNLKVLRYPENRGVSAGRNLGIKNAGGEYLIFLSDDVIVPEIFIERHVGMLQLHPRCWVIMGLEQLGDLRRTPFGRFLDSFERKLDDLRKAKTIDKNLWEMNSVTARNLSLPRADLEHLGLFDEQFHTACEDQDLAYRAKQIGIRFLYSTEIICVHNDQMADLRRYCKFQGLGAHDTALFCLKHKAIFGKAPIAKINGYISFSDSPTLFLKKLSKFILAAPFGIYLIEKITHLMEKTSVPDSILWRMYRLLIGLHIFNGWREGLNALEQRRKSSHA